MGPGPMGPNEKFKQFFPEAFSAFAGNEKSKSSFRSHLDIFWKREVEIILSGWIFDMFLIFDIQVWFLGGQRGLRRVRFLKYGVPS